MQEEKILVLGGGLAGCVLAHELQKYNSKVYLADDFFEKSSSRVAAGIFNPILAGHKRVTWRDSDFFDFFPLYYKSLEQKMKTNFFHPMPMLHFLDSIEDQNEWDALQTGKPISNWFSIFNEKISSQFNAQFGAVKIHGTGWLDTRLFVQETHAYFKAHHKFIAHKIPQNEIKVKQNGYEVMGEFYDKIVLCTGEMEHKDGFFSYLPFKPVKGEILDVEFKGSLDPIIYHKKVFLLPIHNQMARVGSTYIWDKLDYEAEPTSIDFLNEKLSDFFKLPYTIKHVHASLRPATNDRRPYLGEHPSYKNLYIFNGMGSKGVSMVPYWAKQLGEFIFQEKPLDKDAWIGRVRG